MYLLSAGRGQDRLSIGIPPPASGRFHSNYFYTGQYTASFLSIQGKKLSTPAEKLPAPKSGNLHSSPPSLPYLFSTFHGRDHVHKASAYMPALPGIYPFPYCCAILRMLFLPSFCLNCISILRFFIIFVDFHLFLYLFQLFVVFIVQFFKLY